MSSDDFQKGDHVAWNTPQGETTGKVKRVVKKETKVGGTKLKGSAEDPVYLVESDKSGKEAGHKGGALKKD